MDVQTLTFIIVGLSFALYIGIAIWARAGSAGIQIGVILGSAGVILVSAGVILG